MRFFPVAIAAILHVAAALAPAEVITSEFFSVPEDEGWTLVVREGEVFSWADDGVYHQDFPSTCALEDVCGTEAFTLSVDAFNGNTAWFYEFRVSATGGRSEIIAGAPTSFSAFNAFGELYLARVASDQVKLFRDSSLPVLFFDLTPGILHRIRIELDNSQPPTYEWFIDSVSVDAGLAEDVFPSDDARITWQGRTWMQPTLNAWDYIRFGDIPIPASGDFNSDGQVDDFEVFYIDECIQRSAAGEPAHPSCSWSDVNGDNTVDCTDWEVIAGTLWTGPTDPPPIAVCVVVEAIPAVSQWGALVMALVMLGTGAIVFRANTPRRVRCCA